MVLPVERRFGISFNIGGVDTCRYLVGKTYLNETSFDISLRYTFLSMRIRATHTVQDLFQYPMSCMILFISRFYF